MTAGVVEEWLNLVNGRDEVVGRVMREEAWASRLPVRVVNAFLINSRGERWIPRCAENKRVFPMRLEVDALEWREVGAFSPFWTLLSTFMRVFESCSDLAPDFRREDFSEAFWLRPRQLLARIAAGDRAKGDLAKRVQRCDGEGEA
ncbi:hypothetical protein [Deinococcus hopiensis]|uniref:Uncharacterized protein n=1 Tax=Deinococcus hopiensis KR-140 TaxID=695939 RepID=A0A1W1VMX8_9DEIO|nr:hypothetical protein [Deinococcus hopiensis]SMB94580.1 hypothetical protein SAMN00790413_02445 [Deinococcus hopiensis KR-140]